MCHPVAGHPNVLLQSAAPLCHRSAVPFKSEPRSFCSPQQFGVRDLFACSSALWNVAPSLPSDARSLRLRRLLRGVLGALWELPLVWPGPVVPLSHAPAQQPPPCSAMVRGTMYINGGCLACAHRQREGWGIVRIDLGLWSPWCPRSFHMVVPAGLGPCGCHTMALSSCLGNGSGGEGGSEGLGQAQQGMLAAPRTGCLVWLQLPFGKGWQSQLPEGEWDLLKRCRAAAAGSRGCDWQRRAGCCARGRWRAGSCLSHLQQQSWGALAQRLWCPQENPNL